jgi:hypothetical protein
MANGTTTALRRWLAGGLAGQQVVVDVLEVDAVLHQEVRCDEGLRA